jgi:hypothetical protein
MALAYRMPDRHRERNEQMKSQHKSYKLLATFAVLLVFALSAIGFKPELKALDKKHYLKASNDRFAMEPEESEEDEHTGGGHPDGLKFRRLQMQDEKGVIPADGLEKARRQVELMKAAQKERDKNRPANDPLAGIKPSSWTWLGPGNIGGRIRSIVIHPTLTNRIWAGSVSGGIWRSENGGDSWFPVDDFMASLAVSTMIIAPNNNPNNPDTLYAGTGEGFGNVDGIQGAGIFKSVDGGTTWARLANTNPGAMPTPGCGVVGAAPCPAFWSFVNRLAISLDGSTILAATSRSVDASGNVLDPGGIARSVNGGVDWIQRTTVQTFDINFLGTDNSRAVAGALGAARFSTNGGVTWTAATFTPAISNGGTNATNGRVELATHKSFSISGFVYASVNQNGGEVYRSNDSGQTYTRCSTGTNYLGSPSIGWYTNIIWSNPNDPDNLIVGGVNLWHGTINVPTGTLPLTQISDGSQNADGSYRSAHTDHHVIVEHPGFNNTTNKIAFFGNDGGIYRTDNIDTVTTTSGWVERNNDLGITQFYGAAGNAATGEIVGGTQDNGTLKFSGNPQGWTEMFGSDGGYVSVDQTDNQFIYGERQNLQLVRSTNGGISANYIFTGIGDTCAIPPPPGCQPQTNFIAPLLLDPNEPNTLLAGGWSLWRSTNVRDATPTWASIKNPTGGNSAISAIAVSPITSNLILVGHNNGDIYRTFTGTFIPPPNPDDSKIDTAILPSRMVTRLVIDSTRSTNWIYATFGGFSDDNVYRTTDNGATWTDMTGGSSSLPNPRGLPAVPVRTLVYHPSNANLLYVGTEVGIFSSDDAGATWEVVQNGPANVSVDELFWMGGDLIAVTHGRGIYRASGGIYVDCNWGGPFAGTFDRPFKTITDALNAAPTYRTIWLKPCIYTEPAVINQRVELRNLNGPATIRKP